MFEMIAICLLVITPVSYPELYLKGIKKRHITTYQDFFTLSACESERIAVELDRTQMCEVFCRVKKKEKIARKH